MLYFQGELGADGSAMGIYLSVYSLEASWCPDFRVSQGGGQHCGISALGQILSWFKFSKWNGFLSF